MSEDNKNNITNVEVDKVMKESSNDNTPGSKMNSSGAASQIKDEILSPEENNSSHLSSENAPSDITNKENLTSDSRSNSNKVLEKPEFMNMKKLSVENSATSECSYSNGSFPSSDTSKKTVNDDAVFVKPKDKERGHCYCGKDRNLNIVELLCANCSRWFHESCIGYQLGKSMPFMMNYIFLCKNCSPTGLEIFKKNQATIPQLCVAALANLMQSSIKEGQNREYFSKDSEIVTFIDSHWEGMTTNPRRVTQSWHSTVSRTLAKETTLFRTNSSDDTYGLYDNDLTQIKPNYEAMIKAGHLKITDGGVQLGGSNIKGRSGGKRKAVVEGTNAAFSKRTRVESAPVKLSAHGYPLEHPYNKDSFRYFLAEPDPHAPFRQEFDESSESAGRPIPGWLYRPLCPNSVLIALHDRASQLRVTDDRLSITGEKGYCLARATHYVTSGIWYYEVTVTEMKDSSASRIGWGQPYANLQTPLGYDKFGYSWRSRKGTAFHEAKGYHFSSGYGEGDTLGLLIKLPKHPETQLLPTTLKDRPLVKFKSHLYYEEKDNLTEITKNLKPLPGSEIVFFKNGKCVEVAFKDIYLGSYYPAVSLYKSCVLTLNFGPNFKYPPSKTEYPYKPMCERAEETICEQTLSDLVFLIENEGELKLDL